MTADEVAGGATTIDVRQLVLVNDLAELGMSGVADNLGLLAGERAEMDVRRTHFVEVADIPEHVDDDVRLGVRVRLRDIPGGHVLVLFPEESAQTITRLLLSEVVQQGTDVSSEMARSAVEELGNMMASGFVDGWADVLGTSIDISTPQLVYAPAGEIVERTAGLADDRLALIFDSDITVPGQEIEAEIYAFPEIEGFVRVINALDSQS